MLNWISYSGLCFIVSINPLHWRLIPYARRDRHELEGPKEFTGSCGWLFLTIRLWIDDGSW